LPRGVIRCHKIVEAQDLAEKNVTVSPQPNGSVVVEIRGKESVIIAAKIVGPFSVPEIEDGYVVRYADGYISWSPRKAFEEGYAAIPPDASHGGDGKKE
jgi:hypothetical protein